MSLSALLREMDIVITLYEREIGVPAARTRQMIERHGAIEALIVRHEGLFPINVVEAAQ